MRYIKKFEDVSSLRKEELEEAYKIVSEQLFYELDDRFRVEPGVFFPLKLFLEERNGRYDLTIALGFGWIGRMSDSDTEWLSDRVIDLNNHCGEYGNFWASFMGGSCSVHRIVFEMANEDYESKFTDCDN